MSANEASARAQRGFLWIARSEYALLLLISISISFQEKSPNNKNIISTLLLILAGIFVYKVFKKRDQDWYRCRALAESIKTSTWRFCMRAHPYEDADNIEVPKSIFRNMLRQLLASNQTVAQDLDADSSEQCTESMLYVRRLDLDSRINFYIKNRIDDQRKWYAKKSASNKKSLKIWIVITIGVYILAFISLHAGELYFNYIFKLFDPLIVLATSVLGWIQMKRHGELAASYNLAAHEIGIIKGMSADIKTENQFSDFVNEAELAFSREHTQWIARKDAN
ncbi:DUF4231 domain-containing protein [Stappia indica]|uniref:DUF4231 domain-containing protein n=2 Tax=Stappia indica TaxID=538381 RepID=A0A857C447_9HYPH|nr:DUF4231 domain-containing protein [Stappia indica]